VRGKHDKSGDDEQSANLLLTGPIAIRGLGRGVKEALRPGRPSRHRAFAADGTEHDIALTPIQQILANGLTVGDAGPSSDVATRAITQAPGAEPASFPSDGLVTQTGGDGPQEDRLDHRAEYAAPADEEVPLPAVEQSSLSNESVDDWAGDAVAPPAGSDNAPSDHGESAGPEAEQPESSAETEPPEAEPVIDEPFDEFDALPVEESDAVEVDASAAAPQEASGAADASTAARGFDADDAPAVIDDREQGEALEPLEIDPEPVGNDGLEFVRSRPGPVVPTAASDQIDVTPTQAERGPRREPASVGDPTEDPEPAPITVIQETEQRAAQHDERQWVTAEELFRLPQQRPLQHAVLGTRDEPVGGRGSLAAGDHDQDPSSGDARQDEARVLDRDVESHSAAPDLAEPEGRRLGAAEAPSLSEPDGSVRTASVVAAQRDVRRPLRAKAPTSARSRRDPLLQREGISREAIGIAVLVVLALVCAGLITTVVIKTRHDAVIAASEAARYTPPPLMTPGPLQSGPVVAVIGDGSTTSARPGVGASRRWTALLESSLHGTVSTVASGGMGYAAKSTSGDTFVQAAGAVPSDAKVVIFFGGAADSNIASLSLAKAATDAFAAAKERAPHAKILVVGPAIASGVGSTDLSAIRNTLRSAAAVVKATWVDPMDKKWLPAAKQTAAPADLTVSDEKALASRMQDAVKKALG
jgi:hypothetical protein